MVTGTVTADREAIVPLQVRALGGRPESFEVVVDTGFTEFLALSQAAIARLGLPYRGNLPLTLADGTEADFPLYRAIVEWHDRARPVSVLATQQGALLGMALLDGSRLTMDAAPGATVQIQPISRP